MKFAYQDGHNQFNTAPDTVQCLKVRRDIPIGRIEDLSSIVGAETQTGGSETSWDSRIPASTAFLKYSNVIANDPDAIPISNTGVFYPKRMAQRDYFSGYALQWTTENVTFSVASFPGSHVYGNHLIVEIEEDMDHLPLFRYAMVYGSYAISPWMGYLDRVQGNALGAPDATELQIRIKVGYPYYDRGRDAIAIAFTTAQVSDRVVSYDVIPYTWASPLKKISKFVCEFNNVPYVVEVDSVITGGYDEIDTVESKVLYLPLPTAQPAGAIRVTALMTSGESYPWQQFLFQPMGIIDSPDGIGNYPGNFVTARRSFGFTAPVTKVRWSLGFSPLISSDPSGYGEHLWIGDSRIPSVCTQSFRDQEIYFDTSDLDKVYSTPQVMQGAFHAAGKNYPTNYDNGLFNAELGSGRSSIAVSCDDTASFTGYPSAIAWPWFTDNAASNYSTIDTKTEIEKWMHPCCPKDKVLSGSCVFGFEEIPLVGTEGFAPKLLEPVCTINGTQFFNYPGWDATTTRDGEWIVLMYSRAIKRWELRMGHGWEIINLMSIPWTGEEWVLATISELIDGTIASVAWKVIYDLTKTPSIPSFEIWFRKSIDAGYTWEDAVLANTVQRPFLTRVTQDPNYGIMRIGQGTYDNIRNLVESKDGGATWN